MLSLNWLSLIFLGCTACTVFFPIIFDVTLDTDREVYNVDSEGVFAAYSVLLAMGILFFANGIVDLYNGVHDITTSLPTLLMELCVAISSLMFLILSKDVSSEYKLVLQICIGSFHNIVIMIPLVFYMLGENAESLENKLRFFMVPLAVAAQFSAYPFLNCGVLLNFILTISSVLFTLGAAIVGFRGIYVHFYKRELNNNDSGFKRFDYVFHIIDLLCGWTTSVARSILYSHCRVLYSPGFYSLCN